VLVAVFLEFPLPVIERTDLACLEPAGNAMEVESVIADTPSDGALLGSGGRLVGLTLDAQIHDVISADGTVVHHDVPGPQSHGVPLFHLEPFLFTLSTGAGRGNLLIIHVHIHPAN